MKRLIVEEENEGFLKLMGQRVTLFCANYFYTGELIGVNDEFVLLTNCGIVFETGSYDEKEWKDYQKLPHDIYVQKQAIEAFGIVK